MKLYEVTDEAAEIIDALRDESYLHFRKAEICDVMCAIVDRATECNTIAEDVRLLSILSEVATALTDLSKCKAVDRQKL